jgi:hypothetical protein
MLLCIDSSIRWMWVSEQSRLAVTLMNELVQVCVPQNERQHKSEQHRMFSSKNLESHEEYKKRLTNFI